MTIHQIKALRHYGAMLREVPPLVYYARLLRELRP